MTACLNEKNGKYHVILSWYQDGLRKRKSISTGIETSGNNKRRAEAAQRKILAEWEEKITDNFTEILFSDYLSQWLETVRRSIATTTYHSYRHVIEKQIVPYFASRKTKLRELKPFDIQQFYEWKMSEYGVTANTIHHYHANIHKALKDAARLELIKDNPASKVVLPKKERFLSDFYTVEELRTLLNLVKGTALEIPVYLSSWFGLRRGEVVGIRWRDIDYTSMTVHIQGTVVDKGIGTTRADNLKYREGITKTQSSLRSFPLPDEMAEYLKRVRTRQNENMSLLGSSYNVEWRDFVCVDAGGNLIKPDYISRTFPAFLKKHGLRRIRFHELRASNASLLLANGVDMSLIQIWLGHAHYSTTANLYAKHRTDAKQTMGDVVSSALSDGQTNRICQTGCQTDKKLGPEIVQTNVIQP
jgi:integrase